MKHKSLFLGLVSALLPFTLFAATGTAIPGGNQSAPFIITKPGAYYLAENRVMIDAKVNEIEIQCDNVTLDLNGFTESYSTNDGGFGDGTYGEKVKNFQVRNGSLSSS